VAMFARRIPRAAVGRVRVIPGSRPAAVSASQARSAAQAVRQTPVQVDKRVAVARVSNAVAAVQAPVRLHLSARSRLA
jgi:hypothetical protein